MQRNVYGSHDIRGDAPPVTLLVLLRHTSFQGDVLSREHEHDKRMLSAHWSGGLEFRREKSARSEQGNFRPVR